MVRTSPSNPEAASDEHVLTMIRQRIVRQLAPGDRMPTTRQLAVELNTSHATAQRAVHRLANEGFLHSDGRRGTFIRENPPHRSRYAIVFVGEKTALLGTLFWGALQNAAALLENERSIRFQFHYDVEQHRAGDDYQALLDDIENDRIAGLIFTYHPGLLGHTPLLYKPDLPRVGFITPSPTLTIPAVYPDRDEFINRAIAHLASQGRKRLAVFGIDHEESVLKIAKRHGLELRPHWFQYAPVAKVQIARQIAMLLMQPGPRLSRPDAILILDDHLAAPVAEGLIAAGITTLGKSLGVVSLANFPHPPPNPLHFELLGFDVPVVLGACVDRIVQQRTGVAAPAGMLISPRFSHEPPVTARVVAVG